MVSKSGESGEPTGTYVHAIAYKKDILIGIRSCGAAAPEAIAVHTPLGHT